MIRRYCAGNRLNRLGTLTYAWVGCHDPREARTDVAGFFKRLRAELGGEAFAYLWVPEWHPGGHGLHLHFAVGRYIKQSLIRDAWRRGMAHIKLLGDLPVGSGTLGEARLAARYLGKYAGKAVDGERPAGLHRYEVAQGFKPVPVQLEGASALAQLGWVVAVVSSPTRMVYVVGALGNALVAVTWLVSRTTGLPFGPGAGEPEPVGIADAVSTAFELAVVVGTLLLHRGLELRRSWGVRFVRPAVALAAIVITTLALAELAGL